MASFDQDPDNPECLTPEQVDDELRRIVRSADLDTKLASLISVFCNRARMRLHRDGQKLVDAMTQVGDLPCDVATVGERITALRASILDVLCEVVPNAKTGRGAGRGRRGLPGLWESTDSAVEPRITNFPEVPLGEEEAWKDEWDLAALDLEPTLLLPGPKLEARAKIDVAMENTAHYLVRMAGKLLKVGSVEAQRVIEVAALPSPTTPQRQYKTMVGKNIDALRLECGWTFVDLAVAVDLAKTSVLAHVNRGARPRPETLSNYAIVFSEKLERQITVENLTS